MQGDNSWWGGGGPEGRMGGKVERGKVEQDEAMFRPRIDFI
jgi:hypothetical protein